MSLRSTPKGKGGTPSTDLEKAECLPIKPLLLSLQLLDARLTLWLNGITVNPVFDRLMPFFDRNANWMGPLLVIMVVLLIWGKKRGRAGVLGALLLAGLTDITSSSILKPEINRLRPCNIVPHLRVWRGEQGWIVTPDPVDSLYRKSPSFPSGHATNSMGQAFWWGALYPSIRFIALVLALTIGYSRIYIGAHYAGDVIAGWLWGASCAGILLLITFKVFPSLRPRRSAPPFQNDSS